MNTQKLMHRVRRFLERWSMSVLALAVAILVVILFLIVAPEGWRKGMVENLVADIVVVAMAFAIFEVAHGLRERSRAQDEAERIIGFFLRKELLWNAGWIEQAVDKICDGKTDPELLGKPVRTEWRRIGTQKVDLLAGVRPETLEAIEHHYEVLDTLPGMGLLGDEVASIEAKDGLSSLEEIARLLHLRHVLDAIQERRARVELKLRVHLQT